MLPPRMEWMLRLIGTGIDGQSRSCGVMGSAGRMVLATSPDRRRSPNRARGEPQVCVRADAEGSCRAGRCIPVRDGRRNDVLFELAVTKTWLRQVIVALPLICHSPIAVLSNSCVIWWRLDWAPSTTSFRPSRGTPLSSTTLRTCPAFEWACMMRSSRGRHPCWPASMLPRLTAIYWWRRNTGTPAPGHASAGRHQAGIKAGPYKSPTPGKVCVPGRKPPGRYAIYSLRVFSPASAVEVNGPSKTGMDATI
jgi:hypothetical protein